MGKYPVSRGHDAVQNDSDGRQCNKHDTYNEFVFKIGKKGRQRHIWG